jgi:hypothetical protein
MGVMGVVGSVGMSAVGGHCRAVNGSDGRVLDYNKGYVEMYYYLFTPAHSHLSNTNYLD